MCFFIHPKVKKTAFAQGVRCASLGSRRTLCGNEKVSSLKTDGKMRDACLDLQKNKKKKKKKKDKNGRNTVAKNKKKKTEGGKKGEGGRGAAKKVGGWVGRSGGGRGRWAGGLVRLLGLGLGSARGGAFLLVVCVGIVCVRARRYSFLS